MAKKPPVLVEKKDDEKDEIEKIIKNAKRRIGIQPVTLDDIDRIAEQEKVIGKETLTLMVKEFLNLDLKMDEEENMKLGEFDVHRKEEVDNNKVCLSFNDEESCNYINREGALSKNDNVRLFSYIPPQMFKHYSYLLFLTFKTRKADPRLKTMIILGRSDLILKTKLKNITDWKREDNLEAFGKISNINMTINWLFVDIKSITSPPKGRIRKIVHKMSSDSETDSPDHKKMKKKDDDQDEENKRKVADFVSKLEKNSRYSQSKLNFTKLSTKTYNK